MQETTPLAIKLAQAEKAYRTAVRLKYSLMADEEIKTNGPGVLREIHDALQMGRPIDFSAGAIFKAVEDGSSSLS
jgi:hypothetical protein